MEKEMIRYGTYFTWKDKQGNINTECNRACDLEGCALTLPTFSLTKVAIPSEGGQFVLKEDIKCEQVATLQGGKWDKMHDIAKRVYGTNGISPTLHTCGGGNLEPKIMESITEYELSDKMKKYINSYDDKYKVNDGNLVVNKVVAGAVTTREGSTRTDASSYISKDFPENTNIAGKDMTRFRVRKLTERECFKLMGVKVEDFSKIRRNQSKSSCYHLAGDSIVSTVLMALFGQMLDIDWQQKVKELVGEIIK